MQVVQIVSGLPPHVDGVGHYALALAKEMKRTHGVQTHFVVCKLGWKGADAIDGFPVHILSEQTPQALHSVLQCLCAKVVSPTSSGMPVLLQMSAYGYHKHAFPFWLEKGLRNWLSQTPNARLVTMFHELYAFGTPWKKAFWASPLQRLVASRITKASTSVFTNMQGRVDDLTKWDSSKRERVQVFPVHSTVGEPVNVSLLHTRARRLIVFGQAAARLRVWHDAKFEIEEACRMLGITEICDVGPEIDQATPAIEGVKIISKGVLSENEISSLMLDSVAGILDYFKGSLGKSTIFAAYCAHAVLTIMVRNNCSERDGLIAGEHYWVHENSTGINLDQAQCIADNARAWYSGHSLAIQSEAFVAKLKGYL